MITDQQYHFHSELKIFITLMLSSTYGGVGTFKSGCKNVPLSQVVKMYPESHHWCPHLLQAPSWSHAKCAVSKRKLHCSNDIATSTTCALHCSI